VLLKDIDWVRGVAEKIDKENHKISEKLKNLELENYVDNSEKKFLIDKIIKENEKLFNLDSLIGKLLNKNMVEDLDRCTFKTEKILKENLITQDVNSFPKWRESQMIQL